jgi:hypothetical protein
MWSWQSLYPIIRRLDFNESKGKVYKAFLVGSGNEWTCICPMFTLAVISRVEEWWLILCVCLTGLRGAQMADKTFLIVSVRAFPEELSIWISGQNKEDDPSIVGRHHLICLRAWKCWWRVISVFHPRTSEFVVLGSLTSGWIIPPTFLILQLCSFPLVESVYFSLKNHFCLLPFPQFSLSSEEMSHLQYFIHMCYKHFIMNLLGYILANILFCSVLSFRQCHAHITTNRIMKLEWNSNVMLGTKSVNSSLSMSLIFVFFSCCPCHFYPKMGS